MPPIETLSAFAAATLIFAVMPGPGMLYTAARTLAAGRRAGFFAVFGIHVGCYAHVLAATFGLSAIFAEAPTAYFLLKIAGALYLAWLGLGLLREAWARDRRGEAADVEAMAAGAKAAPKSPRRAFVESVLVEVLNPKVALFFIAFLPQFVDPAGPWPLWLQFLTLGLIVNATFTFGDAMTVLAADRVMRTLKVGGCRDRAAKTAGGAILLGLGAHLAAARGP